MLGFAEFADLISLFTSPAVTDKRLTTSRNHDCTRTYIKSALSPSVFDFEASRELSTFSDLVLGIVIRVIVIL